MGKIKNTPVHILIDLENLEYSLRGELREDEKRAGLRLMIDEIIADLKDKRNVKDAQVHVFMTTRDGVDWTFKRKDKLEKHFKYHVVSANKKRVTDFEYSKADMDAAMGTVLGVICAKNETEEVWIITGDGDYIPAINFIQGEFPSIKIKVGCVPHSTKGDLLKIVKDAYYISLQTPGVNKAHNRVA